MADSMPAIAAQSPLQPGAAHGSSLVEVAHPLEAQAPSMPGPNPITNPAPTQPGGAGSSLVAPWSGQSVTSGIRNGGQEQGSRSGPAWPSPPAAAGVAAQSIGSDTGMDVRCIDIPAPPRASGADFPTGSVD